MRGVSVRWFGLTLTAILLAHHFALWALIASSRGIGWLSILSRWDAEHYSAIATEGYSGTLWGFFPLTPALMRLGAALTSLPPVVVGAFISSAALVGFVLAVTRWAPEFELAPTKTGLFLVLYGPASFALHSAHTESLFLLFSALALGGALRGRWLVASLFAAAAMWTRLPGVFLAFTVLALLAGRVRAGELPASRLAASAMVITCAGVGFLAFELGASGSAFSFLTSVNNQHAASLLDVVRAFWLGNPWQNTSAGSIQRHLWFLGILIASVPYVRQTPTLGAYVLLSLVPFLAQAEFVNAFRHPLVLFPLWFWLGKQLERGPWWAQAGFGVLLVTLNHLTATRYALGLWAY